VIDTTNQEELAEWLCSRIGLLPTKNLRCIGRRGAKGDIIGVIGYDSFTNASVQMHSAGEGNWLSKEFLRVMFDYPFVVCKLKVVYGCVLESNERALKLNYRVGFKYEHTLKDCYLEGGAIIMSMSKDECRYLKEIPHG
jgi:RimJ/RimL family protein N-acetyltransferase